MAKLYKYDGPAMDYNGRVRLDRWIAYVRAYSKAQALMLLKMRYKKENIMCDYVVLKDKYLNMEE